jgi:hypothetical protein
MSKDPMLSLSFPH